MALTGPLVILLSLSCAGGVAAEPGWKTWKRGKLAEVLAEDRLYTQGQDLCLHLCLKNLSGRELAYDPKFLVGINQWCSGPGPQRGPVDESRGPVPAFPASQQRELSRRFKLLPRLKPGQKVDYYTTFSGSAGRQAVDREHQPFLILVLEGQVRVTDGRQAEQVGRLSDEFSSLDLGYPLPIHWLPLPEGAPRQLAGAR